MSDGKDAPAETAAGDRSFDVSDDEEEGQHQIAAIDDRLDYEPSETGSYYKGPTEEDGERSNSGSMALGVAVSSTMDGRTSGTENRDNPMSDEDGEIDDLEEGEVRDDDDDDDPNNEKHQSVQHSAQAVLGLVEPPPVEFSGGIPPKKLQQILKQQQENKKLHPVLPAVLGSAMPPLPPMSGLSSLPAGEVLPSLLDLDPGQPPPPSVVAQSVATPTMKSPPPSIHMSTTPVQPPTGGPAAPFGLRSGFKPEDIGICKFFLRGSCTWGDTCKFIHPAGSDGAPPTNSDRRDNSSRDDAQLLPPPPAPPVMVGGPPLGPHPRGGGGGRGRVPFGGYGPVPPMMMRLPPPPMPPPMMMNVPIDGPQESAWERGLKQARELMKKANEKKESDENFEEKRLTLPLSGDDNRRLSYSEDESKSSGSPTPMIDQHSTSERQSAATHDQQMSAVSGLGENSPDKDRPYPNNTHRGSWGRRQHQFPPEPHPDFEARQQRRSSGYYGNDGAPSTISSNTLQPPYVQQSARGGRRGNFTYGRGGGNYAGQNYRYGRGGGVSANSGQQQYYGSRGQQQQPPPRRETTPELALPPPPVKRNFDHPPPKIFRGVSQGGTRGRERSDGDHRLVPRDVRDHYTPRGRSGASIDSRPERGGGGGSRHYRGGATGSTNQQRRYGVRDRGGGVANNDRPLPYERPSYGDGGAGFRDPWERRKDTRKRSSSISSYTKSSKSSSGSPSRSRSRSSSGSSQTRQRKRESAGKRRGKHDDERSKHQRLSSRGESIGERAAAKALSGGTSKKRKRPQLPSTPPGGDYYDRRSRSKSSSKRVSVSDYSLSRLKDISDDDEEEVVHPAAIVAPESTLGTAVLERMNAESISPPPLQQDTDAAANSGGEEADDGAANNKDTRRDELLKQLKAVEEAIAKKRVGGTTAPKTDVAV